MYRDNIPEVCEEVAEELAPRLSEVYGVDIDVPAFHGTSGGYESFGTAMRYNPAPDDPDRYNMEDAGRVHVREDWSWFHAPLTQSVAHELGHAALYQNSDFKAMRNDDYYDPFVLDAISEGVAQHVERTARRGMVIDAVKQGDPVGAGAYTLRYTGRRGMQRLWDLTGGRRFPSSFSRGRRILTGTSRERVRDVIEDPDAFYEELVDEL